MNIKDYITDVPNFPKEGVIFKDITPLLMSPDAFYNVIENWAIALKKLKIDKILAAEARGFFFGAPLALAMDLPFIPVRKKGKLPRETISESFGLEYGSSELFIHKDALEDGDNVVIIDDVLATGGTAKAMCNLVKKSGANVAACSFLLELDFLKGREKIKDENIVVLYHS